MLRRSKTLVVIASAAVLASACSGAATPAAEPAPMAAPAAIVVNPVGKWSVSLVAQGQMFDFEMNLAAAGNGTYTGTVTSQAFPPMPVTGATLIGNRLKFTVVAPTGDNATFDLLIEGDNLSGDWAMPGDGSKVSGRRIP